jgi:hypothetical protein
MALAGATIDAALIYGAIPSGLVVLAVTAQAMFVVLAAWSAYQRPLALSSLLTLTLLVRMLSLAARILTGNAAVDPDTELFYNYGRATIEVGVPIVEYPSGALLIWALMALPASRELFALVLPCLNLACDLAIVWGIATIGQNTQRTQPTSLPALAYAFTPLLLPFWHGKYDPLPAALTIVGLALFVRRPFWSGSALGLGGTIKWVPWLAMPILLWEPCRQLLRQAHAPQRLGRFVLGLTCAILLASLPFALRDWQAFLSPYTAQGARPLIGESIWFLPALAFEPTLLAKLASPWSGTESRLITPAITLLVQTMALLLLGLAALLLAPQQQRTLALAALAPAVFLLLNRVYSPQYALPISACLLAAGAAVLHERRSQLLLIGAITLMQAANLMVWPFTRSYWLIPSALQFAAGLGATIALAICACRTKTSSSSPQLRSQGLV